MNGVAASNIPPSVISVEAANVSAAVSKRFAPTRNAAPAALSVVNTFAKRPFLPNIPKKDFLNPSIGFVNAVNTLAPAPTPSLSPFAKPFLSLTLPPLSIFFLPKRPSKNPCPFSRNPSPMLLKLLKNPEIPSLILSIVSSFNIPRADSAANDSIAPKTIVVKPEAASCKPWKNPVSLPVLEPRSTKPKDNPLIPSLSLFAPADIRLRPPDSVASSLKLLTISSSDLIMSSKYFTFLSCNSLAS